MRHAKLFVPIIAIVVTVIALHPARASAHCDTMDGPVVKAAVHALESGTVQAVLVWVRKEDEAEIRTAFDRTVAVRKLGPEAKALADRYFFETLVRIHRSGEGVPYTGLKAAGSEVDPGIAGADRALEHGSAKELVEHLQKAVHAGIHSRFSAAMARKNFAPDDVAAGREYVKAYVEFIHFAEKVVLATGSAASGHDHAAEPARPPVHQH